jgi:hypothetical protein
MGASKAGQMVVILVLILGAGLLAGLGWFAPEIRDAWYFAPARARAAEAVAQIARQERAARARTGHYQPFTTGNADIQLRALGVSDIPADYHFDATLLPDKGLRLRALPRSEQVLALKIGAQMYVSQLAPGGGVIKRGWVP